MPCFKDANGREWTITVLAPAAKRARELAGINLYDFADVMRMYDDPVLLSDTLWALCKPAADAVGIDYDAFSAVITGAVGERAREGVMQAIVDFSPSPQWRAELTRAQEMMRLVQNHLAKAAALPIATDEVERVAAKAMEMAQAQAAT